MLRCHSLHVSSASLPRFGRSTRRTLLAATAMSVMGCNIAWAADGDVSDAVLKKMEAMEKRIQSLEAELKQKRIANAAGQEAAPADKKRTGGSEKALKKTPAPEADKGAKVAAVPEPPQDPKGKPSSKPKTLDL